MSNYPPGLSSRDFDEPRRSYYLDNVLSDSPIEIEGMQLDADVRASVSRDSRGNVEVTALEIIKPVCLQHERFGPLEIKLSPTLAKLFEQACTERAHEVANKLPDSYFESED